VQPLAQLAQTAHVPSGLRVTDSIVDEQISHITAPFEYEQVPVQ
jgi:hypothetical protein